ncbi:hypothetical protein AVEN_150648-1 [Araneus ventricosus]|uniref:Uncharacterized protein n=1 Tax=Araneus ventricosus TaxID=182803 RepID=A0A4Y2WU43_ARAVE|nr:hypothetical protein AVEN_150648-1 [Araneus ventricosus]
MASGLMHKLRTIEEGLSRKLTCNTHYQKLMEFLDRQVDSDYILELKRKAKDRLAELRDSIQDEGGKWNSILYGDDDNSMDTVVNLNIDKESTGLFNDTVYDKLHASGSQNANFNATHVVAVTDNIVNANGTERLNGVNNVVNNEMPDNLTNIADNSVNIDGNPSGSQKSKNMFNDNDLCDNVMDCSYLSEELYDTESEFEIDKIPSEGASSSIAAKPTTCSGDKNISSDCEIVQEKLVKKEKITKIKKVKSPIRAKLI